MTEQRQDIDQPNDDVVAVSTVATDDDIVVNGEVMAAVRTEATTVGENPVEVGHPTVKDHVAMKSTIDEDGAGIEKDLMTETAMVRTEEVQIVNQIAETDATT